MASSNSKVTVAAVVSLWFLLPLCAVHPAMAQQETDDEAEFSYRRGEENGPERWGLIRRDWAACSWGHLQSPIRLSGAAGASHRPGLLRRSYRPAPAASLVNRGHDIMVRFDGDAGGLLIDGVAYRLKQMHWHSPSEHAINGRRYDLELHMLHQSDDKNNNKFAVVAQLYKIGRRHDNTLRMLEPYIKRIAKMKGHEEEINEAVDPRRPIRGSNAYYRYAGSFTTPPCTEGVTWAVANKIRHVSRHQVELLREAVHDLNERDSNRPWVGLVLCDGPEPSDLNPFNLLCLLPIEAFSLGARKNARPLQDANGRGVGLYYYWPQGHGTTGSLPN